MRDREGGRGSVLLSSRNGRDSTVLPGFVSRMHRAGDVRRRRGSFSSLLLFFFILFLLSSRFGSSSGLFCFTNLSPRSCSSVIPIDYVSGGDGGDDGRITG